MPALCRYFKEALSAGSFRAGFGGKQKKATLTAAFFIIIGAVFSFHNCSRSHNRYPVL